MKRDLYAGWLRLNGAEHEATLLAANNYASSLGELRRLKEAKSLLRRTIPVTRRILGESHDLTLKMRRTYAMALYYDDSATLDDLRESVATLEELNRTTRRILGGEHPVTTAMEQSLRNARTLLRARETPPPG